MDKLKHIIRTRCPRIYSIIRKFKRSVNVTMVALRWCFGCRSIQPVSREFGFDRGTPIDRRYIEAFLTAHHRDIKGVALEVADATYTARWGGAVFKSEIIHKDNGHPGVTIQGDLEIPGSLPSNRVDVFICTQTLPFLFDVRAAVQSAHQMLKTGGVFLCTVSAISPVSRFDADRWGDYWRFTPMGVERLIKQIFGNAEVSVYGNCLAAKAFLDGLAVEDFSNPEVLDVVDQDYPVLIAVRAIKYAAY